MSRPRPQNPRLRRGTRLRKCYAGQACGPYKKARRISRSASLTLFPMTSDLRPMTSLLSARRRSYLHSAARSRNSLRWSSSNCLPRRESFSLNLMHCSCIFSCVSWLPPASRKFSPASNARMAVGVIQAQAQQCRLGLSICRFHNSLRARIAASLIDNIHILPPVAERAREGHRS